MNEKSLILCHLDEHWIPFKDEDSCISYILRLKSDFDFDISKVRTFNVTFTEIQLNFKENE